MKTTTTLLEIIQSELINSGKNEFGNFKETETTAGNKKIFQITTEDDEFAFIKKMANYDEDVEKIVNLKFFHNMQLNDLEIDKQFKRSFLLRFRDREISRQTLEAFSSQVSYLFINRMEYIEVLFSSLAKYMKNNSTSENLSDSSNLSDNRSAEATLPQDEVNLDVNDTTLSFADNTHIDRSRMNNNTTSNTENNSFNKSADELSKLRLLIDEVFDDFDKKCFLQIW